MALLMYFQNNSLYLRIDLVYNYDETVDGSEQNYLNNVTEIKTRLKQVLDQLRDNIK